MDGWMPTTFVLLCKSVFANKEVLPWGSVLNNSVTTDVSPMFYLFSHIIHFRNLVLLLIKTVFEVFLSLFVCHIAFSIFTLERLNILQYLYFSLFFSPFLIYSRA